MKRFLALVGLLLAQGAWAQAPANPLMIAHRGCWTERTVTAEDGTTSKEFVVPENSVAGVAMAKRFGYDGIECDVRYTADSVMVLLHDRTMNRTVRRAADYSRLEESLRVEDITFDELRKNYVLASADPTHRVPVPTLEELLNECKKHGMLAVLHSRHAESYKMAQQILGDEGWVAFDGRDKALAEARKVSNCLILLDPGRQKDQDIHKTISRLESLGGRCGVSSMKRQLLSAEYCKTLKDKGYQIQSSIFKTPHEVQALRNGVTILLTDFAKLPEPDRKSAMKLRKRNCRHSRPVDKVWSRSLECGALTLEIDFVGTADIILNGERCYSLVRTERGTDRLGMRFTEAAPSLKVKISKNGIIHSLKADVYEY